MPLPHALNLDAELWRERYQGYCVEFHAGRLSPDLFRGILFRMGFRGPDIEAEVRLHWPTPHPGAKS